MIRPIVTSELFLRMPSDPADQGDLELGQDMLQTLAAHRSECVGMAANMVGQRKRVIVFDHDGCTRLMFNPQVIEAKNEYETQEGCLSLKGLRTTKRFNLITVRFQDESFSWQEESFEGWTAQIIQHEIDHCNGIII